MLLLGIFLGRYIFIQGSGELMINKNTVISSSATSPFGDSQARNYSDDRVVNEFCPVSKFWSLFNDQHEVLIGTRGCGKTIILKMMRYSMLRKINDTRARKLKNEKKYIAFYVPLHLEYIKKLSNLGINEEVKVSWFRFAFNCALAQSVLIELAELLKDVENNEKLRISREYDLARSIDNIWKIDEDSPVFQLSKLREKVIRLFYSTDFLTTDIDTIPSVFSHSLCSTLSSISAIICGELNISPTWIVCIDEAEFLDECYQKCINTAFRSDTDHIAYKMATLPFRHTTKQTLLENINVMNGQDFNYSIVDMNFDDGDFLAVTNTLVKKRFDSEGIHINSLEGFVETIGNDNYVDYYSHEFRKEKISKEMIESRILSEISERRKKHNIGKRITEIKKPIIDKLAPVYYIRELYKLKKGRVVPGLYAGATMIRRVSQGNPRIFIRIMNELFNEAKGKELPLKVKSQTKTVIHFSESFCEETQTLEQSGPLAQKHLDSISQEMQNNTHNGALSDRGISFVLAESTNIKEHKLWIERSVAFSRLFVDDDSLMTEISKKTVYQLANIYAVRYWLPMRTSSPHIKIRLNENVSSVYTIYERRTLKRNDRFLENETCQLSIDELGDK